MTTTVSTSSIDFLLLITTSSSISTDTTALLHATDSLTNTEYPRFKINTEIFSIKTIKTERHI